MQSIDFGVTDIKCNAVLVNIRVYIKTTFSKVFHNYYIDTLFFDYGNYTYSERGYIFFVYVI